MFNRISLMYKLISSFVVIVISLLGIIGYITFSKWKASIDDSILQIEKHTTNDVLNTIEEFVDVPLYVNETNSYIIKIEVLDIHNQKEREGFFASVMKANQEFVYSVSYGTEKGEYYGVRRNPENQLEIMRSDAETMGHSHLLLTHRRANCGGISGGLWKVRSSYKRVV